VLNNVNVHYTQTAEQVNTNQPTTASATEAMAVAFFQNTQLTMAGLDSQIQRVMQQIDTTQVCNFCVILFEYLVRLLIQDEKCFLF
jgi:hypothetical protein